MNKWDKVEKKRTTKWTKQDEFMAWFKIFLIILGGLLFNYFVVWA